jgi:CDP-diacylglycerol pyrophosphatase
MTTVVVSMNNEIVESCTSLEAAITLQDRLNKENPESRVRLSLQSDGLRHDNDYGIQVSCIETPVR